VSDFLTATAQPQAFASSWLVDACSGGGRFVYDRDMAGLNAFVLAGGKSTRMGTDKAFVEFGGSTLLARALKLAGSVCSRVSIVGPAEKFATFGEIVEDQFPDHGPLGGIHAALRYSDADVNLLLAVDLPFVEAGFLHHLLKRAQGGKAIAIVPRAAGGWQPLCAIYRRSFADLAEEALRRGANKIDLLFARAEVEAIDETELKNAGFSAHMFRNLNTPEELNRARQAVEAVPTSDT
jgi:molybdenum cofactor guanylyltransferase